MLSKLKYAYIPNAFFSKYDFRFSRRQIIKIFAEVSEVLVVSIIRAYKSIQLAGPVSADPGLLITSTQGVPLNRGAVARILGLQLRFVSRWWRCSPIRVLFVNVTCYNNAYSNITCHIRHQTASDWTSLTAVLESHIPCLSFVQRTSFHRITSTEGNFYDRVLL